MSSAFVDTSGVIALLVTSDIEHPRACAAWELLVDEPAALVTNSYVLCETYALLQRRYGIERATSFRRSFEPLLEIVWIERELHDAAIALLEARTPGGISLVDASAFVTMSRLGIDRVFGFDRHFQAAGFTFIDG